MPSEEIMAANGLGEAGSKRQSKPFVSAIRFWSAALIWLYLIMKLFVYDFDSLFIAKYAPHAMFIYNFKLLIIIAGLCLTSLLMKKTRLVLSISFVVFFPVYIIFWKLIPLVYKSGSWTFALALLGILISFFKSLRYKLIVSTALFTSIITLATSNQVYVIYASSGVLLACVIAIYAKTFWEALRPDPVLKIYSKSLHFAKNLVLTDQHIDKEIRALPVESLSDEQRKKWNNSFETSVLCNRIFLFGASKMHIYQKSGFSILSGVLWSVFLAIITILAFCLLNFSLYGIDPSAFRVTIPPDSFMFFYMSFKAFFFGSIEELSPASTLSRSLAVVENSLAFLMVGIFVAIVVSYKSSKFDADLEHVVSEMRQAGEEIEAYIERRYQVNSIEEAIQKLEEISANMVSVLLWMTKSSR